MNRVGLYAGSFNPFHKGHYNILLKADKIFDKVILAKGTNPDKMGTGVLKSKFLGDRTFMSYDGLLTDFIKTLEYDNITLIRGLRNATDLQYEMTQYRYLQDLMPEIQVVSIFCDKEFEHISSSGIRVLRQFGEDKVKNYLV